MLVTNSLLPCGTSVDSFPIATAATIPWSNVVFSLDPTTRTEVVPCYLETCALEILGRCT